MEIVVPREDVNDDVATLRQWLVADGSLVTQDQPVVVLETCKTVFEVLAPVAGPICIEVAEGQEVQVGQVIGRIQASHLEQPETSAPAVSPLPPPTPQTVSFDASQTRLTDKARELGLQAPSPLMGYYSSRDAQATTSPEIETPSLERKSPVRHSRPIKRVLFIGGGDVGVQAADILWHEPQTRVVGFLDDHPSAPQRRLLGVGWAGGMSDLADLYDKGFFDEALITVGLNLKLKLRLFQRCREYQIPLANAIDPSVRANRWTTWGQGNILCSFVHLGAEAQIGDNNFVAAHSSIDHHNRIGDHNLFGPGCLLSGTVQVGHRCIFGSGVVVQPGIRIGDDCRIASSTTILKDVPDRHAVKLQLQSSLQHEI